MKRSFIAIMFFIFFVGTFKAYGAELTKKQVVGGFWNYKKHYITFFDDGTFRRELRLRGKRVITKCTGKYTIDGTIIRMKNCPRLGEKEYLDIDLTTISDSSFKAIRTTFSSQLGPEGSRSKLLPFKRVPK